MEIKPGDLLRVVSGLGLPRYVRVLTAQNHPDLHGDDWHVEGRIEGGMFDGEPDYIKQQYDTEHDLIKSMEVMG